MSKENKISVKTAGDSPVAHQRLVKAHVKTEYLLRVTISLVPHSEKLEYRDTLKAARQARKELKKNFHYVSLEEMTTTKTVLVQPAAP